MNRVVLLLALAACGSSTPTPVHVEPPPPDPTPPPAVEIPREPLGAIRLVEQRSELPVVTLRVVFDAGSAEDPSGREGLTALTATLMAEGGAGELSYAQREERLFPMAAELSVQVDRDATAFVARVHRDHLDAFYPLFRDVLARPTLSAEDFARVRTQAQNALTLELRGNDDEEFGKEMLQWMLYDGHPYRHPTLGTEAGLGAITLEDVRAHRARVLCGARATAGVAGGYPEGFAARVRDDVAGLGGEGLGQVGRAASVASASRRRRRSTRRASRSCTSPTRRASRSRWASRSTCRARIRTTPRSCSRRRTSASTVNSPAC
jgi:zinc protease